MLFMNQWSSQTIQLVCLYGVRNRDRAIILDGSYM